MSALDKYEYYSHAGITIYHGDCREVLPELEPVDLVLTDPPYGVEGGKGGNSRKYGKSKYTSSFTDDESYIKTVVVPSMLISIGISISRNHSISSSLELSSNIKR